MIRVYVFSEERIPAFLRSLLEKSKEMEIINDSGQANVILIYVEVLSRRRLITLKDFLEPLSAPALVVCERMEEGFVTESSFSKGISGTLLANKAGEQLIVGLAAVASGLRISSISPNRKEREFLHLTPRELEILRLIADGEGNKSIAYLLEISEHTVKFHISSIFEKLHVSSRTEAVKAGITRGFISI